jgi:uncharacterized Fe-S cluster-containing protein
LDDCILCGKCFLTCPQNAKRIRNDIGLAKKLRDGGGPLFASLAPSFVANYGGLGIEAMRKTLKKLGFFDAEETAVGATIVKKRYDEMIQMKEQDVIISSCCHSVNMLIQKYFPAALPSLAKAASPMIAHCGLIKRLHPDAKTVFIGPCISKKAEAEQYPGPVDCVLTFGELSRWLKEEGIQLDGTGEDSFMGRTRLFPIPGGILRSMTADSDAYRYIVVDGVENCIDALREVVDGSLSRCFIEMSACTGSCSGGPAMEDIHKIRRRTPLKTYFMIEKSAGRDDFDVETPPKEELERDFVFFPARNVSLSRDRDVLPSGEAIEELLRKTGKTKPEDELNCGGCGYETCREKAEAVLLGKAELTMCLPYLKERAESFSNHIFKNTPNAIFVLNESLVIQQINDAACRLLNVENVRDLAGENISAMLDPSSFSEVLRTGQNEYDLKKYLAAQEKFVMMTILYERNFNIIIGIMRDVTQTETRKLYREEVISQTMEIADRVIAKQMRSVQEIASLLGETAAETQTAIAKLKETLRDG